MNLNQRFFFFKSQIWMHCLENVEDEEGYFAIKFQHIFFLFLKFAWE